MRFLFIILITTFLLFSCWKDPIIVGEDLNNNKISDKKIKSNNDKIKLFYNKNLSANSITFDEFKNVLKKDNYWKIKWLTYDEIFFLGERLISTWSTIKFSKKKLNYLDINNIDSNFLKQNRYNIYFNKNKQFFYSLGDAYRSIWLCKLAYGIEDNIINLDWKVETSDFGYSDLELLNNIISEFWSWTNDSTKIRKDQNSFIYSYENEEKILLPLLLSIVNKYLITWDKKYIDLFYNEYDKKINKIYSDWEWSTYFLFSKNLWKPKSTCKNYFNKYYNN